MSEIKNNIVGIGWSFPPTFDRKAKSVVRVTGEEDIQQSLQVLFNTRPGERVLEQQYGCYLRDVLFKNMDANEITLLRGQIEQAILHFEPRIILNDLAIDTSETIQGKLMIVLDYTISSTNNRRNAVFPFYLNEGTLLPENFDS